ncbi:hypothetical protein BLA29_013967 [Euroglyphus maynei]|uniref:Uncharacterized protein n=1 Tax=Euroglyphus maynei TaxID=6958 RepID=A0A1Y3BUQ1_EURMA|nr:hypothetical protein BLA29_013967 [Euroglyphus maynei]
MFAKSDNQDDDDQYKYERARRILANNNNNNENNNDLNEMARLFSIYPSPSPPPMAVEGDNNDDKMN